MDPDCVSIITRTKDRPVLISRAIESVLKQTYDNWVHIIVNDGGEKDPLQNIIDKYAEAYRDRLIIINNINSTGAGAALTVGMAAAHSDYVVTHDDDDSWEPEFLNKAIPALKRQKQLFPTTRGVICHTTAIMEYIRGNSVVELYRYSFNGWVKTVALTRLCGGNFIAPISFLFERSVFSELGPFNETFHFGEDWEFYLRFMCKFDIAVLPEHLANYHLRAGSVGTYGNTVMAGLDRHRVVGAILRNQLIREDIATGKFGLGFLVALSASNSLARDSKHRLVGALRRVSASLAPQAIVRWVRKMQS